MAKAKAPKKSQKPIEQYEHKDKQRLNNPPVGLVDAHTDNGGAKKKQYAYDPHLDPQLQWAGKAEHTSFEVPTVSLHVHERIDPRRIIETVRKEKEADSQQSLFEADKKPLREAIEFYKHRENWSNRLIAGDSLLVMNSLLEKEGMGGKVQMVYFDPPYGIKYSSNFQPFIDKSSMSASDKDEDLTAEPEMLKAFRDTWEIGIHSYLSYLRDRLKLAKELLHDTGSVFLQISDENVHRVRSIMDEVFGAENFVSQISIKRASVMFTKKLLNNAVFYVVWYAKDKEKVRYNQLYEFKDLKWFVNTAGSHLWVENTDTKKIKKVDSEERETIAAEVKNNKNLKLFATLGLNAQGTEKQEAFHFGDKAYFPPKGTQWKTSYDGLQVLAKKNRLVVEANTLRYRLYFDDYPIMSMNSLWEQIGAAGEKIYVVQTSDEIVKRCLLMTTMPSDLALDITCGSGTTAYVAEQYGRRWITCDTSRIALTLAKQRLMSANFDYYELAYPNEGVGSGFKYKSAPHITLGSIANNEIAQDEILIDQPISDSKRQRVTGPFTVEAVPAPVARSLEKFENPPQSPFAKGGDKVFPTLEKGGKGGFEADTSVARSGETLRQSEWKDELLRAGVRAKGGKLIEFTRVETARGLRYVQAEAETKEAKPKKVYVVFGPEHAPLEQRTVELAWEEVKPYKPDILLFCALQFDEEAAKDIDEMNPEITRTVFLKAQMNADLLTDDLKKKRSSNESFWLIGQPDVVMKKIPLSPPLSKGESKRSEKSDLYQVEILGFDYYNPKTGTVESGGKGDIAMWMLDHDYDGRSLFPSQVFFPMAGAKEGWVTLAKNLKAEIDEEKIVAFGGTVSLPFTPGKAVAVKIIDARGIESLKIIR